MTYKSIRLTGLAATLLAATLPLHAAVPCEKAPTFKASDFLSASILKSSTYTISSTVPTSGLMGVFKLHTDFGDFECQGVEMLQIRLDELKALEQIQQVSRTKVFADAAKNTVLEPVQTAIKIVSNPVGTVVEIPKGVERLFGRVISGAEDIGSAIATTAKKVDEKPTPGPKGPDAPSSRQDPFGYNTARNVWAQRFGVDPYTSNAVLAAKLSVLARITFGTDAVAGWGVGAIARSANMLTTVDQLVLTETPEGVRAINAERLTQLGVSKESAIELLENRWFTPTLQAKRVSCAAALNCWLIITKRWEN